MPFWQKRVSWRTIFVHLFDCRKNGQGISVLKAIGAVFLHRGGVFKPKVKIGGKEEE
jgi:hypothetical protein